MASEGGMGEPAVKVQQFIEGWEAHLPESDITAEKKTLTSFVTENSNISTAMVEELEVVCGASTLTCDGESATNAREYLDKVPEQIPLTTTGLQEQELKRRKKDAAYKQRVIAKMKYKHIHVFTPWAHEHLPKDNIEPEYAIKCPQAVLTICVYKRMAKLRKLRVMSTYHVLGCQKLTEYRDKIACTADYMVTGEFSSTPDDPTVIQAKDVFQSGFFFIEGVFYNDMRYPSCRDYSQVIIDWSKKHDGTWNCPQKKMEETCFADLSLRLGYPYAYCHQGSCEHVVMVTDIRMLHPDDCQDIRRYPVLLVTSGLKLYKCRVCQRHKARWVTIESPLSPEDPCYFCTSCFRALHYDRDGHKVGDFRAYALPESSRSLKS